MMARTSGKAVTCLVLGILSFCFSILTAIPALIFGILALVEIGNSRGNLKGQGLAISGLVLGVLGAVGQALLLIPAVDKVREAADRVTSSTNLKQLGVAMHNYHNDYLKLPAPAIYGKDGKPLLSWRVALLPYLEHDQLYRQFKLDEPWDSPANKPLLAQMPKAFAIPHVETKEPYSTFYQVFVSPAQAPMPQALFQQGFNRTFGQVTAADGLANTLLIVEAGEAVPWTKPEDLVFEAGQPIPRLGGPFAKGCNVCFADCSTRFLPKEIYADDAALRQLITWNGGENANLDRYFK